VNLTRFGGLSNLLPTSPKARLGNLANSEKMITDRRNKRTSEPNALIEKIHIRQPIILEPRDFVEWLSPSESPPVHLLRVMPEEEMRMTLLNPEQAAKAKAGPAMRGLFD
jgi:hypothetical protein